MVNHYGNLPLYFASKAGLVAYGSFPIVVRHKIIDPVISAVCTVAEAIEEERAIKQRLQQRTREAWELERILKG